MVTFVSGEVKEIERRRNNQGNLDLIRAPREIQRAQCNYSPWKGGGGVRHDEGRAGEHRMARRRGGWVTPFLLEEMAQMEMKALTEPTPPLMTA